MKTENSAHGFTEGSEANGSVAAPKEEPKEITESELNLALYQANKIQEAIARMPGGGAYLIAFGQLTNEVKELSSLRDQLRQRDELIKELTEAIQFVVDAHNVKITTTLKDLLDFLIKKSQKL